MNTADYPDWSACPVTTLEDLHHSDYSSIPDLPGIYYVIEPQHMEIHFSKHATNQAAAPYSVEKLTRKYAVCHNKQILYIGKANGKHGLRQRIRQYMGYGWNKVGNHKGGRAIWQIEDFGRLLLVYKPCTDCEQLEHLLLKEYKDKNGTYPLANWRG